jgi:hypothetical protein
MLECLAIDAQDGDFDVDVKGIGFQRQEVGIVEDDTPVQAAVLDGCLEDRAGPERVSSTDQFIAELYRLPKNVIYTLPDAIDQLDRFGYANSELHVTSFAHLLN